MNKFSIALLGLLLLLISCSTDVSTESKKVEYATPKVDRSNADLPKGSPFDPDLMMDLFVDEVDGLSKFSASRGMKQLSNGAEGSHARMVYKDDTREVSLELVDSGILGLTMEKLVPWIGKDLKTETDKSIDRIGTIKGFPSYEKFSKELKEGEIHLLINKRFELIVKGKNMTYDNLKKIVEAFDFSSLH